MELLRELMAAGAVLLLLGASLWWLRRRGWARFGGAAVGTRALQVVERAVLSPQHSLHLVRLGDCGLLVGVSPAGSTLLKSFAWEQIAGLPPAGIRGPR